MTLTEMIETDISYCDTLIEKNYASSDDVLCLVSKYKKIDNKFGNERHNYVRTIGDNINEIKNIKILIDYDLDSVEINKDIYQKLLSL